MGGLHSAETGPSEMLMELAYRLATEDTPLIKKIRDNVIVTITPAAEPDGRDRYVDWYYHYKINDTGEQDQAPGPPYWGKYIFHDNNRDINYSQMTMRTLLDWYLNGIRRSCMSCMNRSRSCTPSAASRRRIPRSIRSSTASCRGSPISKWSR